MPSVVVKVFKICGRAGQSLCKLHGGLVHCVPERERLRRGYKIHEGTAHPKLIVLEGTQVHPTRSGICIRGVFVTCHFTDGAKRNCDLIEVLRGQQLVEQIKVGDDAPHGPFRVWGVDGSGSHLQVIPPLWR